MIENVKKIPLFDVFVESIKRQPALYRKTLGITLLIVIVKDWYLYCGGMPINPIAFHVVAAVMALLMIYLFACFIYSCDKIRQGHTLSLRQVFVDTAKRIAQVYLICVFIVAFCVGFYYLGHYLAQLWVGVHLKPTKKYMMIIILFTIFPILYGIVVLLFAPILALLKNCTALKAVKNSIYLSWFHWFYVFSLYVFIGIIYILVSPLSLHAHFFIRYHVMIVFDFIVFAMLLPVFTNMALTILSELERMER